MTNSMTGSITSVFQELDFDEKRPSGCSNMARFPLESEFVYHGQVQFIANISKGGRKRHSNWNRRFSYLCRYSMHTASRSWIHCVLVDADTLNKSLQPRNSELVSLDQNLVDIVWAQEKPARPKSKVFSLDTKYSGESSEGKIRRLREELTKKKVKAMVVNMLDEVAWLFNLRGADIDFNPGLYLEPYISPRF